MRLIDSGLVLCSLASCDWLDSNVEPMDFFIEGGLTGVVGPNGCGKSNLVEALRWIMFDHLW